MEKFLHAINSVQGCEWRWLNKLWDALGDWKYVWERVSLFELAQACSGLRNGGKKFAERLFAARGKFDVEREFARLWDRDIVVVSRDNFEYPKLLAELPDAPFLFYRKGSPLVNPACDATQKCEPRRMAIVGTRRCTKYGENIAYDLAEALAMQDIVVVSGLAYGIDAVAHFAVVSAKKPTIAVLASGLFDVTPSAHQRLAEKILETGGTLISEYPPSAPAIAYRFLERNRIIAGLCDTTIVVEAGEKSGASVTARLANEYGREVYAVPGDINKEKSQGCLELIYKGAHPFLSITRFLEDCKLSKNGQGNPASLLKNLSAQEQKIINAFSPHASPSSKALSTNELAAITSLTIPTLNMLFAELEFKGLLSRNPQGHWKLGAGDKRELGGSAIRL